MFQYYAENSHKMILLSDSVKYLSISCPQFLIWALKIEFCAGHLLTLSDDSADRPAY